MPHRFLLQGGKRKQIIAELNDNESAAYQNSGGVAHVVLGRKGGALDSSTRTEERLTADEGSLPSNLKN